MVYFSRCICIIFLIFSCVCYAKTEIKILKKKDQNYDYSIGLLAKALEQSPRKYKLVEVEHGGENTTEERDVKSIQNGVIDVASFGTSLELEERLLPIRFPIFKGLLGYRLLLIRKGEQSRFVDLLSKDELAKISLGQGRFWVDSKILEANGLKVIKVTKYDGIFYMLNGGRFDAFPSGIHEIWGEMEAHAALDFEVESKLLIHYPLPFYFFVSPSNIQLAKDIEVGLFRLLESGEFDRYLKSSKIFKDAVSRSAIKGRRIVELQNPYLPLKTPLDDKRLWLLPEELF